MKKNVLIINNGQYGIDLKRTADFGHSIRVSGLFPSVSDLKKNLNDNVDIVLASDNLFNNDTIEDIINVVSQSPYEHMIFFTLSKKNKSNEDVLRNNGLPYLYELEYTPLETWNFIDEIITSESEGEGTKTSPKPSQPLQSSTVQKLKPEIKQKTVEEINQEKEYEKEIKPPKYAKKQSNSSFIMGILKSRMVTFASSKGGVGKSSLAIETASCIAARARELQVTSAGGRVNTSQQLEVCLADLNFAFGTVASIINAVREQQSPPSLADWVIKIEQKILDSLDIETKLDIQGNPNPDYHKYLKMVPRENLHFTREEALELLVKDNETGLYVLPTIAVAYDVDKIYPDYIKLILEELKILFDIVIVDTGNNISHFTQVAFDLSDLIYIVSAPTMAVTVVIDQFLKTINYWEIDKSKLNLVLNLPNPATNLLNVDSILSVLNIPLIRSIPFDKNLGISHENGKFYAIHHKNSQFAKELIVLANNISPLWNVSTKRKKKSRFFGMF